MDPDFNLDDEIMFVMDLYPFIKEDIENNDEQLILEIEECKFLELRLAYLSAIEDALLEKQGVLTESVFHEEYNRALTLYRTICKENNRKAKL